MNTDRPVVLIHSGQPETDAFLRNGLLEAFPNLGLRTASGREEIQQHLSEAEILVAWDFPFELLVEARNLRWLQMLGAGVDLLAGIDIAPEIAVSNIRGIFSIAMAEHTIAYMLAHTKSLRKFWNLQSIRSWQPSEPGLLHGSTVGIAGLGSIGRKIAEYCSAMGMKVVGMKRSREDVPCVERVFTTEEIDEFLPLCDYLVLVMPGTKETTRLLTPARLRLLRSDSFLVSIGRGSIMNEDDLVEALRNGSLAGAALDVFSEEPLPDSSPLWDMAEVHITPHISGINRASDLLPPVRENLRRYLRGEPLVDRVDLGRGY